MRFAQVAIPVPVGPLGQAFTYSVPPALENALRPGARVWVEFGRRKLLGVVLEGQENPSQIALDKLKPILALVDEAPALPEELLAFLQELSRYYFAPIGEVLALALPAVERARVEQLQVEGLEQGTQVVGRLVQVARATLEKCPDDAKGKAREVFAVLVQEGPKPVSELSQLFSTARAALTRLQKLGAVAVERQQIASDPFLGGPLARDVPPELTAAQKVAVDAVCAQLTQGKSGGFLLDGVTASGKTEVYLRAVARAQELGRGSIVLVPEIALTPQLVKRFRERLGDTIAVLHSALRSGERQNMWRRLRSAELKVAIGARSALFAPVSNLGLICVDEEHDSSFKQEEGVRYNARDMALLRAHRAEAVCMLGSATPSLTTLHLVTDGKLTHLKLPARAHARAVLPEVELVDLRRIGPAPGGERLLSVLLYRELEKVLRSKSQAILFLNRRGFSPSLICAECGHILQCPHCSVALTLHRARGAALRCHYCDYACERSAICPDCKHGSLEEEGAGTERIEAHLATLFPEARVARLDRDVAGGSKSEKVLSKMRSGEIDILVGTQMVTKGHDLPSVTLVGVLNADAGLSMPDFRAAERTFQLLVQVAGRAGRGDRPGRVLIQTRKPEHPAIVYARAHDVPSFVKKELELRRELRYPPFSRLALIRFEAVDEVQAREAAERHAQVAERAARGAEILGPAAAPLARLRNRYRYRFLIRSVERAPLRAAVAALLRLPLSAQVRRIVDIDPINML